MYLHRATVYRERGTIQALDINIFFHPRHVRDGVSSAEWHRAQHDRSEINGNTRRIIMKIQKITLTALIDLARRRNAWLNFDDNSNRVSLRYRYNSGWYQIFEIIEEKS